MDGKNRKYENKEQSSESSSSSGSSIMVEESESTCMPRQQHSRKRKSCFRSPSSYEWIRTSTSEEEDTSTSEEEDIGTSEKEDAKSDRCYSGGRLGNGEEGYFPASKWKYEDLQTINIFYKEKPDPLQEFIQDVKTIFLQRYPDTPDFEKTVAKYSSLTKENLVFTCGIDNPAMCKSGDQAFFSKAQLEQKFLRQMQSIMEKTERADRDLDHSEQLLDRKWFLAIKSFMVRTLALLKRILYPPEEDESVEKIKESMQRKLREKKKCKVIKQTGESTLTEKKQSSYLIYQHYCAVFLGLFFLEQKLIDTRTIVVCDKIVNCTPDLTYSLEETPSAGRTVQNYTLLFVVAAKGKSIKNGSSDCLEELVDSGVLGRVGAGLYAEAVCSALYPNSLGMICLRTKLIFVHLKMPVEHITNRTDPPKTEGKIHYTRPFDMLKAEDRAEICEFLYWLGCIQNHYDGIPITGIHYRFSNSS